MGGWDVSNEIGLCLNTIGNTMEISNEITGESMKINWTIGQEIMINQSVEWVMIIPEKPLKKAAEPQPFHCWLW